MENINIQDSWIVKINNNYQTQNSNINPKDAKFFNTSIFMDFARLTQVNSHNCDICCQNKQLIEDLSCSISEKINTFEGRKELSNSFDKIANHLRKKHSMYIRRYISSVYSAFGLAIGIAGGLITGYLTKNMLLYISIISTVGLCIGTIAGWLKEQNLLKKGKVYGKF